MTRGPIPRFDLYEELEVSRLASVEVIEAAYRSLVKRHHPDVARPKDVERIKRLNLAREWLRDPERRSRYDGATTPIGASARRPSQRPTRPTAGTPTSANPSAATPRPPTRSGPRTSAGAEPSASRRKSTSTSFGVNTPEVRQFLSDLRGLDRPRARQVWDGRAMAHAKGYSAARRRALAASRDGRHSEWLFAREAASVIARGKLGDSTLTAQVLDVVADIAGVLTIRDLISRADFELLLLPWTWRGELLPMPPSPRPASTAMPPPPPAPTATAAPAATPAPAPAPAARTPIAEAVRAPGVRARTLPRGIVAPAISMGRRAMVTPAAAMPLLFVAVTLIALGAAVVGVNRPQDAVAVDVPGLQGSPGPTQAVAGATSAPAATSSASTPPIVLDPAQLRELQQSARRTIRSLAAAAGAGDVAVAQALLGDSAPDLRASGLRSASFPDVATADIAIMRSGDQWNATAGLDRLVSRDGASWAFDYADRPLAVFVGSSERNLYWLAPGGRRDLYLRVASATVSSSGLSVRFAWRYGPGGASGDAPYFNGASITISSVTLGTRSMPLTGATVAMIGASGRRATTHVPGTVDIPSTILIQVAVTPAGAGSGGATARPIATLFELKST